MSKSKYQLNAKWAQILATFSVSLGGISDGMHLGWTSPAIPKLSKQNSQVLITEADAYMLEMLYMAGGIVAIPITIYIVDKLGRNISIILIAIQNIICWILFAVVWNKTLLYTLRFWVGINANVTCVAVPMYIAECADAKTRGFLQTLFAISIVFGTLLVYCIVPFVPIWGSSLIGATIVSLQLVLSIFMPNSPYWLLVKSKREQAKDSLRWLRRKDDKEVEMELINIETAVRRQEKERGRPQDMFLVNSNLTSLLIVVILNTAQHFCGISVILMNAETIIQRAGANTMLNASNSTIIFGICLLIACLIGSIIIDILGRRFLLISSSLTTSLVLFLIGTFFLLKDTFHYNTSGYEIVLLLLLLIYALVFKCGVGLIPIVCGAELFPTGLKVVGMTIADLVFASMSILSLKVYYVTIQGYGMYFPFYLFSVVGLVSAGFVYLFMPETKGRTLEEVQVILKSEMLIPSSRRSDVLLKYLMTSNDR